MLNIFNNFISRVDSWESFLIKATKPTLNKKTHLLYLKFSTIIKIFLCVIYSQLR